MSRKVPRVALIGAGYFSQFHLDAWHRLSQEGLCQMVAICDTDEARAHSAGPGLTSYTDANTMLSECTLDLVDIATPPDSHETLIRLALGRGLAVICQKPVTPTYSRSQQLAALVATASAPVWIHENFRWMPWYQEMAQVIKSGQLGNLHDIAFRLRPGDGQGRDAYLARQPYFQTMPRFLVHETLIHLIDTYRFLMGEVIAVSAQLRRVNPAIAGEDAGYLLLRFASGATGVIDANRLNDHAAVNPRLTMGEAWLAGSRGVMRLDGDGNLHFKPHQAAETKHAYAWTNCGFGGDCVYRQQRHVLAALAGLEAPVNQLGDYMRNIEIQEAVYQSNEQRREIAV